jgi:DNA-binding winged helix-turn-helix (wHTH) protein
VQKTTPINENILTFGPYRLNAAERLLEKDGSAIHLGSRALDLLAALVENAGAVLSKRDLMERVWRGAAVEDVGLRVHISNLRKALGDGKDDARYIVSVAGRGYSFVAPLVQSQSNAPSTVRRIAIDPGRRLPPRPTSMIGREETVQVVSQEVQAHRFVTITGPGGVGKTTVAVSIAHSLSQQFIGAVYFVDLASVSDPGLVPGTLVSALGGQFNPAIP